MAGFPSLLQNNLNSHICAPLFQPDVIEGEKTENSIPAFEKTSVTHLCHVWLSFSSVCVCAPRGEAMCKYIG